MPEVARSRFGLSEGGSRSAARGDAGGPSQNEFSIWGTAFRDGQVIR
jgi:hypothetical protein